jgi:hypothetical protein
MMRRGLRGRAMPGYQTGFLPALCVMLAAAGLLAASGAGRVRADDGTTLKVYFGKEGLGAGDGACSEVAALVRQVPQTQAVYRSWFSGSTGAILKDVRIADRTAYVDLHDLRQLIPGATSSCGSAEFFAQVEATLKQFPTVERVVLAIEGQPRLFYDWMEMECDDTNDYCDASRF